MEVAIKSVAYFVLLYMFYYFALRFIQFVFQELIKNISPNLFKFIYIFSTPAHEFAHLFVAKLCCAQIEQVQLFPKAGRPGFVRSRVGSSIPFLISIKEFLISIAPIIINFPLFVFIESRFILKDQISRILDPRIMLTKEGWITILLFLTLISGIAPSLEDYKGMIKGVIFFSFIMFGVSYLIALIFNLKSININPILTVIFYYLEIIIAILILNSIVNYRNCFKITYTIIINAMRNTFN